MRVTEAKAILTYLREDRAGLERLIASIIAARQEIEKDIASKAVLYKPKTREEVERSMELLGFRNPQELFHFMNALVKASSGILGFEVFEEDGILKVFRGLEMPRILSSLDDFYGLFMEGKEVRAEARAPVRLVAYGDPYGTIDLIPIEVRERRSGTVLYRELVGVHRNRSDVFRGSELFRILSQAISRCLGVLDSAEDGGEGGEEEKEISLALLAEAVGSLRKAVSNLLESSTRYKTSLEGLRLR
ncbi:MAG: helicase, partial [Candidatus Bathyarchaeia archaeon]